MRPRPAPIAWRSAISRARRFLDPPRLDPREPFRRDAHDREIGGRNPDLPSQHRPIAGELLLPHAVAQDGDGVAPGHLILVGTEVAADDGHDAERAEEI